MVGPDYHRPQVTTPTQFKELPGWTQASPGAAAPDSQWWRAFNDPLLDRLEPMVSVSNQTVRQDYANYQAALAEVQVARSGLFPTVGVTGSGTRERSGSGGLGTSVGSGNTGNTTSAGRVTNAGSLEGNVSWAPDLWGKVRRTIEENKATAQASEATLANATLSEQTALATAVIELRISDANIDLLQKTVVAYKESLQREDAAGERAVQPAVARRGARAVRPCDSRTGRQKS
jgi:outer membrane protein TolC